MGQEVFVTESLDFYKPGRGRVRSDGQNISGYSVQNIVGQLSYHYESCKLSHVQNCFKREREQLVQGL